jgi:hypothetical protein
MKTLLGAWHASIAETALKTPRLAHELLHRRDEVLPRFIASFRRLRALPRRLRRLLQRKGARSLAGAALLLVLGQSQVIAAMINVAGSCTLTDAITAANMDMAVGDCIAGSGADTIVLEAGSTHTLTTMNNSTYGPTGLPVIASEITIQGNGSTIARDSGAPEFRLIVVNSYGSLILRETTITGGVVPAISGTFLGSYGGGLLNKKGSLTLIASTVSNNTAGKDGGGIENYSGDLTLIDCTVSGNSAGHSGGGVSNYESSLTVTNSMISGNAAAGGGGGIDSSWGYLTLTNSTISGNTAAASRGGGINKHGGHLTLIDATVSGNAAGGCGGGLADDEAGSTLTNATVSGNTAGCGGGVYSDDGGISLTDSTVSGNSAHGCGGGLFNGDASLRLTNTTVSGNMTDSAGGGLCNPFEGRLFLSNSTVSGNVAGGTGGGIRITSGRFNILEVTQSTISRNTAATAGGGIHGGDGFFSSEIGYIKLARSVIAGNTAPTGPEVDNEGDSKIMVNNFNVFGVDGDAGVVGFLPKAKDIVPASGVMLSDILAPLANNGGPTMTHALVTGSLAIDAAGPKCPPPDTDQRGVPRPQQAACDIGAFELALGSTEICNNCVDDDGNGRIDLLDDSCAAKSLTSLQGILNLQADQDEDRISLQGRFSSVGVQLDPLLEGATVSLVQDGALLACVQIPAGEGWSANKKGDGDQWIFKDREDGSLGDLTKDFMRVRCETHAKTCSVKIEVQAVQLGSVVAGEITTMVVIGNDHLLKTQDWEVKAAGQKLRTK